MGTRPLRTVSAWQAGALEAEAREGCHEVSLVPFSCLRRRRQTCVPSLLPQRAPAATGLTGATTGRRSSPSPHSRGRKEGSCKPGFEFCGWRPLPSSALVLVSAEAPAALAYDDPSPNHGNVIRAWNPQYRTAHFARRIPTRAGRSSCPVPSIRLREVNPFGVGARRSCPAARQPPSSRGRPPHGPWCFRCHLDPGAKPPSAASSR